METKAPEIPLMQASFMEHVLELRTRLMWCVLFFVIFFGISYLCAEQIYQFLVQPLADIFKGQNRHLIYTSLTEAFVTYVKVAFFAAIFCSCPFIVLQMYRFIAPGLYKHERKFVWPLLFVVPTLFILGAALAYYVIIPLAWRFFVGFETHDPLNGLSIQLEARVSDYLSLVMQLIISFGMAFQLPVLLVFLGWIGIISAEGLAKKRRIAIVIIVIVAAILTPPDIMSQILLSVPLWILYECSIIGCKMIEKRRKRHVGHSVDT